jgi:hypothetical protein
MGKTRVLGEVSSFEQNCKNELNDKCEDTMYHKDQKKLLIILEYRFEALNY